jgi:hypothetical protein
MRGQDNGFSEFEQLPIQLSQIDSKGLYGVSRKGTKENTRTIETHNNTVRKHQLFLGIIQANFFTVCALMLAEHDSSSDC